nr:sigma-54-dependent Fis family transcriptional regulator [Paracoccaceae bacterium]
MKQTVLLIDDDEAMRRSTEQALELADFTVQSFASAEAALPLIGPGFAGVEAMRRGAYDFIEKPFSTQALAAVLRRALDRRALVIENRRLRAVAGQRDDLEARLPGRSPAMIDL